MPDVKPYQGPAGQEFAGWTKALQDDRATTLLGALHLARDALERTQVELRAIAIAHASRPISGEQDAAVALDITYRVDRSLRGITAWLDSTGQAAFTSTAPE